MDYDPRCERAAASAHLAYPRVTSSMYLSSSSFCSVLAPDLKTTPPVALFRARLRCVDALSERQAWRPAVLRLFSAQSQMRTATWRTQGWHIVLTSSSPAPGCLAFAFSLSTAAVSATGLQSSHSAHVTRTACPASACILGLWQSALPAGSHSWRASSPPSLGPLWARLDYTLAAELRLWPSSASCFARSCSSPCGCDAPSACTAWVRRRRRRCTKSSSPALRRAATLTASCFTPSAALQSGCLGSSGWARASRSAAALDGGGWRPCCAPSQTIACCWRRTRQTAFRTATRCVVFIRCRNRQLSATSSRSFQSMHLRAAVARLGKRVTWRRLKS